MFEGTTQMGGVWGWRGFLGFIEPAVFGRNAMDWFTFAPDGVGILVATMGINRLSRDSLEEAKTQIDNAARQLTEGGVDFIQLNGPFGLITEEGVDPNEELVKQLEKINNVPCSTSF